MEAKVYGTFIKKDSHIYRTDTYMQFGESDDIIGACVLCNPGSSTLKDKNLQRKLEQETDYIFLHREVTKDNAMGQLEKILQESYSHKLLGKFIIYNILSLRNPNMNKTIQILNNETLDHELLYKDFEDCKVNAKNIPWLLIGWGCKENIKLNSLKRSWLKYINEEAFQQLGIKGRREPHYYHPLPRIYKKQIEYRRSIMKQHKRLMQKNKNDGNFPFNIIEIDELKLKKLIKNESSIREFEDRFEYCIIKEYEEKYENFICDSIQVEDVFIQIITVKGRKIICSIDFPKEYFDVRKLINWLRENDVTIIKKDQSIISNAHSIIKGFKFEGTPILVYKKGNKNVKIGHLPEITEIFTPREQKVDIGESKEIKNLNDA